MNTFIDIDNMLSDVSNTFRYETLNKLYTYGNYNNIEKMRKIQEKKEVVLGVKLEYSKKSIIVFEVQSEWDYAIQLCNHYFYDNIKKLYEYFVQKEMLLIQYAHVPNVCSLKEAIRYWVLCGDLLKKTKYKTLEKIRDEKEAIRLIPKGMEKININYGDIIKMMNNPLIKEIWTDDISTYQDLKSYNKLGLIVKGDDINTLRCIMNDPSIKYIISD